MIKSIIDCIAPTIFSLNNTFCAILKSSFPRTPPRAAPIPNRVLIFIFRVTEPFRLRISETVVIASTVHPERKLIVPKLKVCVASSTGLITILKAITLPVATQIDT